MRGLTDKVAIVTGAGSGLGRGMAHRLAEEGVRVVVFDINQAGAEETVAQLATGGCAYNVDISDYAACGSALDDVVGRFGRVDVLVNNAGWDEAAPFLETEPELWQKIIAINLQGPLNMHHVTLPHMLHAGGGKIIFVS